MVMVEQFRQGSETVELEIPGGVMDAGDASPEATGRRELLEETGYQGEQARVIGQVFPKPRHHEERLFHRAGAQLPVCGAGPL